MVTFVTRDSLRSDACADNNALSSSSFVHIEIANDVVINANIILKRFFYIIVNVIVSLDHNHGSIFLLFTILA